MMPLSISLTLSAAMTFGTPPNGDSSGSFAAVKSFGAIELNATVSEVQAALGKARIPHEFKVFHKTGRVYLTLQTLVDRTNQAGGPWTATVYFNGLDNLTEVLLQSPSYTSAAEAEKSVKSLVQRWGKPLDAKPEGPGQRHWMYRWENKQVKVRASSVSDKRETEWVVTVVWTPTVPPRDAEVRHSIPGHQINPPPKP